jgi:peroxiredoxin family protein
MAGRVVFFVQHGTFEPAYQLATQAVTAAAMGETVFCVLAFDALRRWVDGRFGDAEGPVEEEERERAVQLGLPPPREMLEQARALGARFIACDTTVKLCGLTAEACTPALDEVLGLPSIWRLTEGARVLSL